MLSSIAPSRGHSFWVSFKNQFFCHSGQGRHFNFNFLVWNEVILLILIVLYIFLTIVHSPNYTKMDHNEKKDQQQLYILLKGRLGLDIKISTKHTLSVSLGN